ncbi:Transposable element P transposase-like Protein [Tribolium castaneum]|uniref:Transposable element P transposase-like Protein n=1 Tax=Tribolium castaneum TaxID=7070 RepID=A0A139W8P5_TRICA|nr:Transposable element P transposase-like Protein [Tribolium castaneum]
MSRQSGPVVEAGPSHFLTYDIESTETEEARPIKTQREHLLPTERKHKPILSQLGIKKKKVAFSEDEMKLYSLARSLRNRVRKLENVRNQLKVARDIAKDEAVRHLIEELTPVQQRFLESQLRNYKCKSKARSFTFEDKADAIAIHKSSPRTYRLLSKMFILPSERTLKATLGKVSIRPGISNHMIEVLSRRVGPNEKDRICVLIFDEIQIQPHLDYLPHEDRVIGFEDDGTTRTGEVADHVAVFMIRGVYRRWKQPVAFAFCKSAMKASNIVSFYKQIVAAATAVGLNIVASVCDMGSNNIKAINALLDHSKRVRASEDDVVQDNVIRVPLPDNQYQEVIPLFDPPHLLKAFRNGLLERDCQFTYVVRGQQKRGVAKWAYIQRVVKIDREKNRVFRLLPKISAQHVDKFKIRKMKVKLAAQVLSQRVAAVINEFARPETGRLPPDAYYTAKLLLEIDQIFDSVNGGFGGQSEKKKLRRRVTQNSSHYRTWVEGKRLFSNMAFLPKNAEDRPRPKCLMGWQRTLEGFCLIKNSLQKLGFTQFPARAFNQDPLENFFGQIRQYGVRYTNPTCKAFVPFYKSLLIRNFSAYHSRGSNCEGDDDILQVTIRDFLSEPPEPVDRDGSRDQWHPPPPVDDDSDDLDAYAIPVIIGWWKCWNMIVKSTEG